MGAPNIIGTVTGSVTEDSGIDATGTLSDDGNFAGNTWTIATGATYGTASVNSAGQWTYVLDESNPVLNSLDTGDTLIDTFVVRVTDAFGTDTQVITITINGVTCFARGTRILTERGLRPVEGLRPGDKVQTLDSGLRRVEWVGSRVVDGRGEDAPVLFTKGTMGALRDLYVSPQHRMLVQGAACELHFGLDEVLVPAVQMVNGTTIRQVPRDEVEYFHVLLDGHHVIMAEGVAAESFFAAGARGRELPEVRDWLKRIEQSNPVAYDQSRRLSRPVLRRHEGAVAATAALA